MITGSNNQEKRRILYCRSRQKRMTLRSGLIPEEFFKKVPNDIQKDILNIIDEIVRMYNGKNNTIKRMQFKIIPIDNGNNDQKCECVFYGFDLPISIDDDLENIKRKHYSYILQISIGVDKETLSLSVVFNISNTIHIIPNTSQLVSDNILSVGNNNNQTNNTNTHYGEHSNHVTITSSINNTHNNTESPVSISPPNNSNRKRKRDDDEEDEDNICPVDDEKIGNGEITDSSTLSPQAYEFVPDHDDTNSDDSKPGFFSYLNPFRLFSYVIFAGIKKKKMKLVPTSHLNTPLKTSSLE